MARLTGVPAPWPTQWACPRRLSVESGALSVYNSIRTLLARLHYFHAVSGGLLATLPLELRLRGKSTAMSHRAPIYYVDLTTRTGSTLVQTIAQAKELHEARLVAGMDQAALDEAARLGLARGDFEETEEEGAAVVDEFYQVDGEGQDSGGKPELLEKLRQKAGRNPSPISETAG